jgi:3-dehydroquinate dehydratase-1
MANLEDLKLGEGLPKIVVSLIGKDRVSLMKECKKVIDSSADIVEWRADYFEEYDLLGMLVQLKELLAGKMLLFTYRTKNEGGNGENNEANYASLLKSVIESKEVDFIDIEFSHSPLTIESLAHLARENGVISIISSHNFERTPSATEIVYQLQCMDKLPTDITKVAVMPHSVDDVLQFMRATNLSYEKFVKKPLITMSMGELGKISRVAGGLIGSVMTFASLDKVSAPGQLSLEYTRSIIEKLN